jgi:hypothetical protein
VLLEGAIEKTFARVDLFACIERCTRLLSWIKLKIVGTWPDKLGVVTIFNLAQIKSLLVITALHAMSANVMHNCRH